MLECAVRLSAGRGAKTAAEEMAWTAEVDEESNAHGWRSEVKKKGQRMVEGELQVMQDVRQRIEGSVQENVGHNWMQRKCWRKGLSVWTAMRV